MTRPTEPIEWAESALPGDVSEPPGGVRAAGYQDEDILPHDELNSVFRGIYRWLAYNTNTSTPQTFSEFFSHTESTGWIWEKFDPSGSSGPYMGAPTDNPSLLTKNQLTVYGAVRQKDTFFTVESDGSTTYLRTYPVDGEDCVADRSAAEPIPGFPGLSAPCAVAASDDWFVVAQGNQAFFYNSEIPSSKLITRTDGRSFQAVCILNATTVVLAADERIEHYNVATMPASASEADNILDYDFDGSDNAKDVFALASFDNLVIASGDARTDTSHIGVFSGGVDVGGLTVLDDTFTVSYMVPRCLAVDNTGLLAYAAYDSGAATTMIKTAQIVVAPDNLALPYLFVPLNTDVFSGLPSSPISMDGRYIYVGEGNTIRLSIYDKRNLSPVLRSSFQNASLSAISCVCGADTKFFIGRANSMAHPSAYVRYTAAGPIQYNRAGRLPFTAAAT